TDVPETHAKGDSHGEPREHQGSGFDKRLGEVEFAAKRRSEQRDISRQRIGASQRDQDGTQRQCRQHRDKRQCHAEPNRRRVRAALEPVAPHAAISEPLINNPRLRIVASSTDSVPVTRPSYMTAMRSAVAISSSRSSLINTMAQPLARMARNCSRTKWAAPISSPRVGWATSNTDGSKAISRANSAFCNLSP